MSDLDRIINSIIEEKVKPIQKELAELRAKISEIDEKEYYTASETMKRYKVSRMTLWRLHDEKKLNKHLIKGKIFYKKTELNQLFQTC